MSSNQHLAKATVLSLAILGSADALSSVVYEYQSQTRNGVYNADYSYNTSNGDFSLDFDFTSNVGGNAIDGFWFVNSQGPGGVRITNGEYAIFYSDFSTVWAYQYTGWNGGANDSFNSTLLDSWANAVNLTTSSDGSTISAQMDINVSNLNSIALADLDTTPAQWTGMHFTDTIGTWLHPTYNTGITTGSSGQLLSFNSRQWIGWDESNRATSQVSEPGMLALLGLGLMGMSAFRRKYRA